MTSVYQLWTGLKKPAQKKWGKLMLPLASRIAKAEKQQKNRGK